MPGPRRHGRIAGRRTDDRRRFSANVFAVSSVLRRDALVVERLTDRDRPELLEFIETDPLVNAAVGARLRQVGTLTPRSLGGDFWAVRDADGALTAAALHAGNLMPLGGGPDEWRALAGHLAGQRRLCTSIVGRASAVSEMWRVLAPGWGPARAVRAAQPLLVVDRTTPASRPDPRVRRIRIAELDILLPAAAAMFTEELGISPERSAGAREYRRRLAGLINEGRAFGVVDPRHGVLFKADIGAVSARTCQIHGVWVRPEFRRQGLGRAALAAVLRHALTLAPTVSLYVNDYNTVARTLYARLGFREAALLSTVLF
jgi:predicted GNAT family acetyltransferase